jgi:molybdate transport repressor ModE-like protein
MEHLSLHQIESFLAVAHSGSISRAARELYISQPVVSRYVREVEAVFGAPLLERSNEGVRLTETGVLVYAEIHSIYKRYHIALDEAISRISTRERPALRIGCLRETVMRGILEDACADFERDFPAARVRKEFYTYHELSEGLVCGKLDLIFTHSFEAIPFPAFEYIPLKNVKQYFAVPRAWEMPRGGDFSPLRDKTLTLIASHCASTMLDICRRHGFEPERVQIVDSFLMMTYLLSKGRCYTICGGGFPGSAHYEANVDFVRTERECDELVKIVCGRKRGNAGEETRAFCERLRAYSL